MLDEITDLGRLRRINQALMNRVESQLDQQGNSFSLFQTALSLEGQVKRRTDELTGAMHRLEKINDELALAKEAAEIANQSKTSFLAAASHDVLQPLNAALLSVSVLAEIQTTEKGRGLAAQVERSLENMSTLLGTLLDISRLEAGVMQPVLEDVSLQSVFESLKLDFAPIAKSKNLYLRFDCGGHVVFSDRTMLRRILQNLVSNALRYTDAGGVVVEAHREDGEVIARIRDTGRGISEAQQTAVFEEFNRGDATGNSMEGSEVGFGLGLSIVKKMVPALDHKLSMESKINQGTEFILNMRAVEPPLEPADNFKRPPRKVAQADLRGVKTLLLENDPSVIEAMTGLLDSWHCEVVFATTTQEALERLETVSWTPDIVIADQHLDHGDLGTTALQKIWERTGSRIPSIVASADPTEALEAKAGELGLELMVKPIKPAALRALITHMVSN